MNKEDDDLHKGDNREKLTSSKVYFWAKWASKPEQEEKDKLRFYEIKHDKSIREVIRDLESSIIGKRMSFSEITPENPSVKKWIKNIRNNYPNKDEEDVEYLLDVFRQSLHTRSKKKKRFIVGFLQLNDLQVLLNCRKDPSLAEFKKELHPVKLILHPKNVLRAAFIKDVNGKTNFSVYEHSRKWSKGHADFWDIDPEDVSWESLGNIKLKVELERFDYPVQISLESKELEEMIENNSITPTGNVRIGREKGKITKASVFRKSMDFPDFYDFYITEKEKLEEHRKKFKEIAYKQSSLPDFKRKYRYLEKVNYVYEQTTEGKSRVHNKEHQRFQIIFITKEGAGIKPTNEFLNKIYQSIFQNHSMEAWHAGAKTSKEPINLGGFQFYNKIKTNREIEKFSNSLLNSLQDADSKKKKLILELTFLKFWKHNIDNKHIKSVFSFLIDEIVNPELKFEFTEEGVLDKEGLLDFKSADTIVRSEPASEIDSKPSKFVNEKLIPMVEKYIEQKDRTVLSVLFGIEDNTKIQPIYNLKNDQVEAIQDIANEELKYDEFQIDAYPIPHKDGFILSVFLIPSYNTRK